MKKNAFMIPALLLLVLLALTACGGRNTSPAEEAGQDAARENATESRTGNLTGTDGEITMERVAAANDVSALLSRHDSFLTEAVMISEYDEPFRWETYVEKDFVFVPYQSSLASLYQGSLAAYLSDRNLGAGYLLAAEDGDLVFSTAFPAMPEEDFAQSMPEDYGIINTELTLLETITDVSEQEDQIIVSTELNGGVMKYTLDASTLEIISTEETSVIAGEETTIILNVLYDTERPELADRMLADMEECGQVSSSPAVLTVIYDPGDPAGESYSRAVDRKFQVSPILKEGYELCYDTAGEEPFLDYGVSLADGDVTMYAIPY